MLRPSTRQSGVLKLFTLALLVLAVDVLHGQYVPRSEFGDLSAHRRTEMDTNNVRTTVYNFGFSGRTGVGQGIPFEWPKGTNRVYLALVAMFVGGEVIDTTGDTIQIVSVPAYRQNLATGGSWNFEPVAGYTNPSSSQCARSDDPSSWPSFWQDKMNDSLDPGWSGSWNGFFGKNRFINGTELYFHYSDDLYDRHAFFPDSTILSRRGLGIVASQRVLAWKAPFLADAIVTISDIYNVGTKDIARAAVTFWVADFVGGDGDSQDDRPAFDLTKDIVYFMDSDGISNYPPFMNSRVGTPALVFLQTPEQLGITNIQYLAAGAIDFLRTPDSFFWTTFMTPGSFVDPAQIPVGESDLFASCGFFTIQAGAYQRLSTAIVFGNDSLDADRKATYLKCFAGSGFTTNVTVVINSPTKDDTVSGQTDITWTIDSSTTALVDLLYSSDAGTNWQLISRGEQNDGSFQWNTDSLADGILYKLQLIAYDSAHVGVGMTDGTFTVNNPSSASPQIILDRSIIGSVFDSNLPITWVAGDADGDSVSINFYYRIDGVVEWTLLSSGIPNTGILTMDISALPNSKLYWLKATVTDGSFIREDSVGAFEVRNPRYGLHDSALVDRRTIGTGLIRPLVVDSAQLTGHTYEVTLTVWGDSTTSYSVIDENTSTTVISNETNVTGTVEGKLFDGMRLLIKNDPLTLDTTRSGWNRTEIFDTRVTLFRSGYVMGVADLGDYRVEIGEVGIDTSQTIRIGSNDFTRKPVNFQVTNTLTGSPVPFAFREIDGSDGRWSASAVGWYSKSDIIVLLKMISTDSLVPTWMVSLNALSPGSNPQSGDTLVLIFRKPFQTGDTYRFEARKGELLSIFAEDTQPEDHSLLPNYPNPFNPSTTIEFSIPHPEYVQLRLYNILGEEVRTLVSERMNAGHHVVTLHADDLPSGVYFYQLQTGEFVDTKKMVLIR